MTNKIMKNNTKAKNNIKNKKNYQKKSNKNIFYGLALNFALIVAVCYAGILTIELLFPLEDYELIKKYSNEFGVDESLVCAIINVESGFDPLVISSKGASGYMQLMEQTANWGIETLGIEDVSYDNIFEPELNIELGTWYLQNLLQQFGSEDLAIISYNAGSGNVTTWLEENNLNEEKTIENIPFKETKNYYYKVKFNKKVYSLLLKYLYI